MIGPSRGQRRLLLLALGPCLLAGPEGQIGSKGISEGELKVRFFEAVCRFLEWPGAADKQRPFVLGILGDPQGSSADPNFDPVAVTLLKSLRQGTVRGRKVVTRTVISEAEIAECQALYVPRPLSRHLRSMAKLAKVHGILLWADVPGGGLAGAHVNLFMAGTYVRYELNLPALKEARFQVAPGLLAHAVMVSTPGGKP